MKPEAAKRLRLLASAISVLLLLAVLFAGWLYWRVRASRPLLDGTVALAGLASPVTVLRDALGIPRIQGANRGDVSRALGWLHAQDRFFQIDVLRRLAAGELSALVGRRALSRDRTIRPHRFRERARQVVERLPAEHRAILDAYVAGVNAGLEALGDKPFEYLALRETPQPWLPEDTILVVYAMAIDLQDETGNYERSLTALRDELGRDMLAFLAPVVTPDDAALDGTTAPLAAIPGPRVLNLRGRRVGQSVREPVRPADAWAGLPGARADREFAPGSNAFALAGAHTASGAALLANDMHLDHGVPTTWYRAALEFGGRRIVGVTLPGTPAIVAGSNGDVAWGFTNAYIDTSDLVAIDVNSIANWLYTAPGHDSLIEMERRTDQIAVKGDDPETLEYTWTVWGPIVAADERRQPLALRWTMHDPEALNFGLLDLEQARTVDDGLAVAHRAGIPAQNILLADRQGNIAWTIAGRIPKRVGFDGRLPVSWTFGDRKWDGYLSSEETPVIRGPDSVRAGRLWSANQRHVGGEALAKLGDGAYRRAHRAAQIRDRIATLEKATPQDLLAVQLDDRALFLERWHRLMLQTLAPAATSENRARAALREHVERWEGRASVEAVSYWLVREFRIAVYGLVFTPIFESCREAYEDFSSAEFQLEPALWRILEERPEHLLNPQFQTWDELLRAACDEVIKATDKQGISMDKANWGRRNTVELRHPFSYSFPWFARWLGMPATPLPGGDDMPRVQSPRHGASERLVVSPGREEEGILHQPGGQSGHPLSPYFRAGHDAWVRGEPTPLLPGETRHTLTLQP